MSGTIDYKLGLDPGDSVAQVGKVNKALLDTEKSAENVESAGKAMAKEIAQAADDIERELTKARSAGEKLEKALGPDLVSALNASGRGVDGLMADLRAAGLTYDDIEADVDELAASIKRLNDVGMNAVNTQAVDLDRNMGKVRDTTDQSRSVMANFTGNAIQEIPLVSGMLGPLNMAIGQTAEYAAEGNINFGKMAMLAGPMAGVGLVLGVISHHADQVAKSEAFHTGRVDAFTKAIQANLSAVEVWNAGLTGDKNKLEFVDAATGDLADLTAVLARQNITWDEFNSKLNGGKAAFEAWARDAVVAKEGHEDLNHTLQAGWQLIDDRTDAAKKAADQEEVYGRSIEQEAAASQRAQNAAQGHLDVINARTDAARLAATGLFDLEKAQMAVADSWDSYIAQLGTTMTIMADSTKTTEEKAAAERDLREAELALFAEVTAVAEAYAKETGAKEGTTASTALQIEKLEEMKAKYPLLVEEIDAYIAKLRDIPGVVQTEVSVYGGGTRGANRSATGTNWTHGPQRVGEHGEEIIEPPDGSKIHSAGDSARMAGAGPSVTNNYITVINPARPASQSVYDLQLHAVRNG